MKKLITLIFLLVALTSYSQTCKLPDAVGVGQLKDFTNYFEGKPYIAWVTWSDPNNNSYYAFNYKNPEILGYEVFILNSDKSVFLNVKNWTFHSMEFYLYDDPARLSPFANKGGNFYCAFPVDGDKTYSAILKVHCKNGSVLETAPETFAVLAPAPPPAPTTTLMKSPVSKKK